MVLKHSGSSKIHPYKFTLWVACASILMMFAALTSAYIVRKAGGNWLEFGLPTIFYYSTTAILLSSITLHSAYVSFLRKKETAHKLFLLASFILGLTFIVLQYQGWTILTTDGIELTTNPSSSFLFVISGLHVAHVIGGLVAIFIMLLNTYSQKFKITPIRKLRMELTTHYWHFIDVLWLYLLFFLFGL